MFPSRSKHPLLGLDITTSSVKLIELVENGRGYRVESYAAEATPPNSINEKSIVDAEAVGEALRRAGWGWLDRRGHLRVWTAGLRVESPIGMADGASLRLAGGDAGASGNPWTTVGLELALWTLVHPDEAVAARAVARGIERSPGAVHEMITRFSELGLIGPTTKLPLLPEMFWETAAHWPDDGWVGVPLTIQEVAERVGSDVLTRVDGAQTPLTLRQVRNDAGNIRHELMHAWLDIATKPRTYRLILITRESVLNANGVVQEIRYTEPVEERGTWLPDRRGIITFTPDSVRSDATPTGMRIDEELVVTHPNTGHRLHFKRVRSG